MFNKEIDMQELFVFQLKQNLKTNEIIFQEFDARFGNVDVVKTTISNDIITSYKKMIILKNYQCAKVIGYLHKRQPHNIKYLMEKSNYTYDNICIILNKLKKNKIVEIINDKQFIISKDFEFPNIEITSYELKLKEWKKAISQAIKNKNFSSYSYVVLPSKLAKFIATKDLDIFKTYNIGLIGINNNKHKIYYKPKIKKNTTSKNPTYISSLAKIIIKKEKEQII